MLSYLLISFFTDAISPVEFFFLRCCLICRILLTDAISSVGFLLYSFYISCHIFLFVLYIHTKNAQSYTFFFTYASAHMFFL